MFQCREIKLEGDILNMSIRDDLKRAFDSEGNENEKKELLIDILKKLATSRPSIEVISGDAGDLISTIKERLNEYVGQCLSDLLEPYKISTQDKELMVEKMTLANLDFDIDLSVPNCSIALVKRKEREYIQGFKISLGREKGLNFGGITGMSMEIDNLNKSDWEQLVLSGKAKEKEMNEMAADMMVKLFGDKNKVIELLNNTMASGECNCPKCKIREVIDKQFEKFIIKGERESDPSKFIVNFLKSLL
jgi:hypothetical protein